MTARRKVVLWTQDSVTLAAAAARRYGLNVHEFICVKKRVVRRRVLG